MSIILLVLGIYIGYKLRFAIETFINIRDTKRINIIVKEILNKELGGIDS